jgi:hypothetical protein
MAWGLATRTVNIYRYGSASSVGGRSSCLPGVPHRAARYISPQRLNSQKAKAAQHRGRGAKRRTGRCRRGRAQRTATTARDTLTASIVPRQIPSTVCAAPAASRPSFTIHTTPPAGDTDVPALNGRAMRHEDSTHTTRSSKVFARRSTRAFPVQSRAHATSWRRPRGRNRALRRALRRARPRASAAPLPCCLP